MSHYFLDDKNLKHRPKRISFSLDGVVLTFHTDTGVFSKDKLDFGTLTLLKNITVGDAKTLIDMGTGYGPIGIYLAHTNPQAHVIMADANPRAVELAKENILLNNIKNAKVILSDLFKAIDKKADLIVTNPPIRAGKQTVFRLYEEAYENLNSGGHFYCVIQKKQGAPSTLEKLKSLYPTVDVIDRAKGYWIILAKKD